MLCFSLSPSHFHIHKYAIDVLMDFQIHILQKQKKIMLPRVSLTLQQQSCCDKTGMTSQFSLLVMIVCERTNLSIVVLGSCQHTKEVTMSVEKPLDGDFPLQAVVY
jgi:hypothetical protein